MVFKGHSRAAQGMDFSWLHEFKSYEVREYKGPSASYLTSPDIFYQYFLFRKACHFFHIWEIPNSVQPEIINYLININIVCEICK